jgi:hypothetical protein
MREIPDSSDYQGKRYEGTLSLVRGTGSPEGETPIKTSVVILPTTMKKIHLIKAVESVDISILVEVGSRKL